jgi:hypothetical protein
VLHLRLLLLAHQKLLNGGDGGGARRRWRRCRGPMSSSLTRAVACGGSGIAVAGKFKVGSGSGARREWHGGGRRVRARLGRRHMEGAARQWPASSSSAGGGCAGRERHGGGGREAALCRQSQDARESGGRFTEATKMPIPRRRQNGALGKIDSVQSTLGIGSFGSTRRLFSMEAAYNLSQTGP